MADLSIPASELSIVEDAVAAFAAPGPTLDANDRQRLARFCRTVRAGDGARSAADPLEGFASVLTLEAHRIDAGLIADLRAEGTSDATLVEIVALVAQLIAVDTFCFALGHDPIDLPGAGPGTPTGRIEAGAAIDGGWLPTVGPASPPNALSMLPDEHDRMHRIHGCFYLEVAEMADLDADRGLHRTQMELVASRTSLLNECFF